MSAHGLANLLGSVCSNWETYYCWKKPLRDRQRRVDKLTGKNLNILSCLLHQPSTLKEFLILLSLKTPKIVFFPLICMSARILVWRLIQPAVAMLPCNFMSVMFCLTSSSCSSLSTSVLEWWGISCSLWLQSKASGPSLSLSEVQSLQWVSYYSTCPLQNCISSLMCFWYWVVPWVLSFVPTLGEYPLSRSAQSQAPCAANISSVTLGNGSDDCMPISSAQDRETAG